MNAIILAAGLGSRFGEITKKTHKSLLEIDGTPNIERTIHYLLAFGIHEIVIVVGYLSETFSYLPKKYKEVTLVYNEHFATYNNIYTFQMASPYFGNSFVIDADVVMLRNVFKKHETSVYYTLQREKSNDTEWIPITNPNGDVAEMEISSAYKPSMLGISYWTQKDSDVLKSKLPSYLTEEMLSNPKLYWDNIPISCFEQLTVGVFHVDSNFVDEMDTLENYKAIQRKIEKGRNS